MSGSLPSRQSRTPIRPKRRGQSGEGPAPSHHRDACWLLPSGPRSRGCAWARWPVSSLHAHARSTRVRIPPNPWCGWTGQGSPAGSWYCTGRRSPQIEEGAATRLRAWCHVGAPCAYAPTSTHPSRPSRMRGETYAASFIAGVLLGFGLATGVGLPCSMVFRCAATASLKPGRNLSLLALIRP